jgi:iron complex transport system ATP-binding protein
MVLEIRNVTVTAGKARLIEDVSLSLQAGKLTVVLGANGAGKSTALAVLAGDTPPSNGEALLDGVALGALPPHRLAARRAVVLQHAPINFAFKVHEIVALSRPPLARSRWTADHAEERALHALDLTALADRSYPTLSGGERQRVQIARALAQLWHYAEAGQTGYLLMDEPTAHLDLKHQIVALEAARDFTVRGGAALCILHDLRLAHDFGDEIVLMKRGQIAARGTPDILKPAAIASIFDIPEDRAERLAVL